jgi:adenylate kinase
LIALLMLWGAGARAQIVSLQIRPVAVSAPPVLAPALSAMLSPLGMPAFAPALAAPLIAPSLIAAPVLSAPIPAAAAAAVAPAPALPAFAAASSVAGVPPGDKKPGEASAAQAAKTFDGGEQNSGPLAIEGPRLIITGPPGSGKGTYSAKLAADYGVVHVAAGDLLREYAKTDPEVAAIMASGRLVDPSLVLRIVRERLARPDVQKRGFLLDGFPRRAEEAAALAEMLGSSAIDGVIVLDVPEAELLRRILARGRADDREEVLRERMRIYREQTLPAVERFTAASPVLTPSVTGTDIPGNYARVKAALGGLLDKLRRPGS